MAVETVVTLENFEAMAKKLEQLGHSVEPVMLSAVEKGAQPIKADWVRRVRRRSGAYAKSINIVPRRGGGTSWQGVRVQSTYPAAHFVEQGHRMVVGGSLKEGGKIVGEVPAYPAARPAFRAKKKFATAIVTEELRKAIMEVVG